MYITANFGSGSADLTDVGFTILHPDGTTHAVRSTTGVSEVGNGLYGVEVADADLAGNTVLWDTGATDRWAAESFPAAAAAPDLIADLVAEGVLVADGNDYRFTANALELAPTGSGGGGGATLEQIESSTVLAKQATLNLVKAKTDNLPSDPADQSLLLAAIQAGGGVTLQDIEGSAVLAKQAKLDTLEARLTEARATAIDTISAGVTSAVNGVNNLLSRLSATRATYLDNLSSSSLGQIYSYLTDFRGYWTNLRAAKLDNLDATISSRATPTNVTAAQAAITQDLATRATLANQTTILDRLTAQRAANLDNLTRLDVVLSTRPTLGDITDGVQTIVDGASVEADLTAIAADASLTRKILTNKQDDDGTKVKIYEDDDNTLIGVWSWDEGAGLRGKLGPEEE